MNRFALGLAATAFSATAALAQATVDVDQLDTDNDDFASQEELMAMFPDFDPTFFDEIDMNDDGRLSAEELNTSEAQAILSRYQPTEGSVPTVDVAALDADGDGFVSEMELMAQYPSFDPTFLDEIDTNDDGRISMDEINTSEAQAILSRYQPQTASEQTWDIATLDADGDGFVSQEELMARFPTFDMTFFDEIDTNDDGRISPDEINTSEAQTILSRYE